MASHLSSPGLACCKPGGRDIFFILASWFLMGAVGEEGKKQNRLQYSVEESRRVGKGQETQEGAPQGHLLQSTQSRRASADRHTKDLQDTSTMARGHQEAGG